MSRSAFASLLAWAAVWLALCVPPLAADALSDALNSKRFGQALEIAEKMLSAHPRDPALWVAKGWALEGLGREKESLASFERALQLAPNSLPALKGAAQMAYKLRDPRTPDFLDRILSLEPENGPARVMAGTLALEAKDCDAASGHLAKAGEALEGYPEVAYAYGRCLMKLGRPAAASPVFERLLETAPESAEARYSLAVCQLLTRKPAAAAATLEPAARDPQPAADVLNLLAAAQYQSGRVRDAVETLQRAMKLYPEDVRNYEDLATISLDYKKTDQALELLDYAVQRVPESARLRTLRGMIHLHLSNFDQATADFQEANRLDPEQTYATIGLGKLYSQRNEVEEAIRLLRGKLKDAPADWKLNFLLAAELLRNGAKPGEAEFAEARRRLDTALQARPGLAHAHALLGRIYLETGELEKAVEELRTAVRQDPRDKMALNHLMRALRKTGRTEEAAEVAAQLQKVFQEELREQKLSRPGPG